MLRPEEKGILAAAGGAVIAVGDDGRIAFASEAAQALVGWGPDLIGQPLITIIPERLRGLHAKGFRRYVDTGVSHLSGKTVRVPALRRDGTEQEVDLTIRIFRRPDGSKLVSAGLSRAPLGEAPPGLVVLETALVRRLYALI